MAGSQTSALHDVHSIYTMWRYKIGLFRESEGQPTQRWMPLWFSFVDSWESNAACSGCGGSLGIPCFSARISIRLNEPETRHETSRSDQSGPNQIYWNTVGGKELLRVLCKGCRGFVILTINNANGALSDKDSNAFKCGWLITVSVLPCSVNVILSGTFNKGAELTMHRISFIFYCIIFYFPYFITCTAPNMK